MQKIGLGLTRFLILVALFLTLTACVTERQVVGGSNTKASADSRADNSAKRAVSYMDLKQYKTAEDILKTSLKEMPKNSVVNYTYALLKLKTGETKKANKYFKIAVNSDPTNSRAAHDYGYYLCSQNKVNDGIEMFELAITNPLFKQSALSNLRAGECVFNKDTDKAEQYFLSAYQENPNLSVALFRLAELNFFRKKALSARAYYQRYSAVQGDSAASLYLAYRIEVLAGAKNEALIHRTKLLKKFPGSNEAKQIRKQYKN